MMRTPHRGRIVSPETKEETMIRIKSKQRNFRRCGIAHPDTAIDYPDDKFTPGELTILKAEPMLIVEMIEEKVAAAGDADIAALTVAQLIAEIEKLDPLRSLKAVKKAELVEILKALREGAGKKE